MIDGYTFTVEEHPTDADVGAVVHNLIRFNDSRAEPEGWRRLAIFLRGADGRITGGLLGWTHWGWLFISHLWLAESLRNKGGGQQLMQRAEEEARRRGCRHAWVDTFSFQARGFYQKLGYQLYGALDDFPPGHTRFFLQKRDL